MARTLIVEIVGDTKMLEKSYRSAERGTKRFGQSIEKAGRGATVATVGFKGLGRSFAFASAPFLTGAGLVAGMKASVDAASNLNEQISKTNVVFGRSAAEVKQWSETSSTALGLAQDQALAVASSFGALFKPLGLVGPEAARQSEQLTQLGADLASFYNTDVQSALDAIRSGLVGESEPLRQYGILLSEARVQTEALTETHKHSTKELTDQEKVLARITLIYKDSTQAQGDFARTQGGLANQTRILKANLRDLAATVGGPVGSALEIEFRGWNKILGAVNRIGDSQKKLPLAPEELRVVVPRLAGEYERFRKAGLGVAEAHERIVAEFADAKHGAELLGAALDYIVNPQMRAKVAKLQHSIEGVGLAAEAAAKAVSGIRLAAAARAAAVPRGQAALGPEGRLGLALAGARLTPGTADDMATLVKQHEFYSRTIQALRNRLGRASGKEARDLADRLKQRLADDASALAEITSINTANATAAADAAAKIAAAAKKREEAAKKITDALKKTAAANVKAATERVAAINKAAVAQEKAIGARGFRLRGQRLAREQRQQFRALGLAGTGEERLPTALVLLRRLRTLGKAIQGTDQDTKANRAFLTGALGDLLGRHGKVTQDTIKRISEFYDTVNGALKTGSKDTLKYFKRYSAAAIVSSLGGDLTSAQRRRIELMLSGVGPGLSVPGGRSTAYAAAGAHPNMTIHTVNVHGVQDLAAFEDEMIRRQRARAYVRRGAR